jgi:hypothetical protein
VRPPPAAPRAAQYGPDVAAALGVKAGAVIGEVRRDIAR